MEALVALCRIFDTTNDSAEYMDYAVITDLSVEPKQNEALVQAITDILELHPWKKLLNITATDAAIKNMMINKQYDECRSFIHRESGLALVDELVIPTNARGTCIMIGRSYESAHIVVTGDGTGILDCGSGFGFCRIDEIYSFLPLARF